MTALSVQPPSSASAKRHDFVGSFSKLLSRPPAAPTLSCYASTNGGTRLMASTVICRMGAAPYSCLNSSTLPVRSLHAVPRAWYRL